MNHSSKLTGPMEEVLEPSDLQPVGKKDKEQLWFEIDIYKGG